jgi:hypothetical protein
VPRGYRGNPDAIAIVAPNASPRAAEETGVPTEPMPKVVAEIGS